MYCTALYCIKMQFTIHRCEKPLQEIRTLSISQVEWVTFNLFIKPVLYCTVLYCTVLYCTVLYCTVPYCTESNKLLITTSMSFFSIRKSNYNTVFSVQYSTAQYNTVLLCTVQDSTAQYNTVLCCTVQYSTAQYKTTMPDKIRDSGLYYTLLYYTKANKYFFSSFYSELVVQFVQFVVYHDFLGSFLL